MHPTIVQDHPGDCPICGMKLVPVQQAGGDAKAASAAEAKPQYQCPMHPTIVQDHPGDCPICGMKLVKMESSGEQAKASGERKILYYRSPMDAKQTSPTPRKDEMGMDYLPVYADEVAGGAAPVGGLATVNIDPARQQLIGLKTAAVVRGKVGGAWRTVGRVAMDETRVRHINVKIPAYVERIDVDFIGKPVRKGEPLFSIYSPELLSAQEEYLLATKTRKSLAGAGGLPDDGDALVSAARRKLQLWDVPESEIERLEKTGQPTKGLTIHSPISGVVTKKDVVEGMKLDAGAMPYEIVDLSEVWVLADVYESELRHVKAGMPATLTLNAYPNRAFQGRVSFVDPLLDPRTRTVKVRLAFPNPTGELKPEMFGEVVLHGAAREGLRVPTDAVIDSGTSNVVFVSLGEGKFQPREVKLGDSDGQTVEVTAGVAEGEQVVTRANFLIDSESRLRASLAEMANKQSAAVAPASPTPAASAGAGDQGGSRADAHAGHGARQP
jgi:Cu(I)/Ag(I) efflux system membrane fusion protein